MQGEYLSTELHRHETKRVEYEEHTSGHFLCTITKPPASASLNLNKDEDYMNVTRLPLKRSFTVVEDEVICSQKIPKYTIPVVTVDVSTIQMDQDEIGRDLRGAQSELQAIRSKTNRSLANLCQAMSDTPPSGITPGDMELWSKLSKDCSRPSANAIIARISHQGDCVLCLLPGDHLATTSLGKFAHPMCVIYTPETYFSENHVAHGIENIPKSRYDLKCNICKKTRGGNKVQCKDPRCVKAYHVLCAQEAKLLTKSPEHGFTAWCPKHMEKAGMEKYIDTDVHEAEAVPCGPVGKSPRTTRTYSESELRSDVLAKPKASPSHGVNPVVPTPHSPSEPSANAVIARISHRSDCALCLLPGDHLATTSLGTFAHPMCVIYTPETYFDKNHVAHGIENIPKSRYDLKCNICKKTRGGNKVQCKHARCTKAYHVLCAQEAKLLTKSPQHGFTAWCPKHMEKAGMEKYIDIDVHEAERGSKGPNDVVVKPKATHGTTPVVSTPRVKKETPLGATLKGSLKKKSGKKRCNEEREATDAIEKSAIRKQSKEARRASLPAGSTVSSTQGLNVPLSKNIVTDKAQNTPESTKSDSLKGSPASAAFILEKNLPEYEAQVGDIVNVAKRMGTNQNKEGGVGRIQNINLDEHNKVISYDITYVLNRKMEKGIPKEYVKRNESLSSSTHRRQRRLSLSVKTVEETPRWLTSKSPQARKKGSGVKKEMKSIIKMKSISGIKVEKKVKARKKTSVVKLNDSNNIKVNTMSRKTKSKDRQHQNSAPDVAKENRPVQQPIIGEHLAQPMVYNSTVSIVERGIDNAVVLENKYGQRYKGKITATNDNALFGNGSTLCTYDITVPAMGTRNEMVFRYVSEAETSTCCL